MAVQRPPAYIFEAEFEPDRERCLEAVLVVLRSPAPDPYAVAQAVEEAHLRDCAVCRLNMPADACPTGLANAARREALTPATDTPEGGRA